MSWLDSLERVKINGKSYVGGSFRGEAFFVETSTGSGGRNGETHEFPDKETDPTYREDRGRAGRKFALEVYCLGENCLKQADALEKAFEESGPGELIHPYKGRKTASLVSYQRRDVATEGRIVRFSLDLEETSEKPAFGVPSIDLTIALNLAGDAALLALKASFLARYDPTAVADDFLTDLETIVRDTARALNAPGGTLVSGAQELAAYRARINAMINTAGNIVRNRIEAYEATERALKFAIAPPRVPSAILQLLAFIESAFASTPKAPSGQLTTNRQKQGELFVLLRQATKRQVLIKMTAIAAAARFDIFADSIKVRDKLISALDAELADEGDDYVWQKLLDVRAGVMNAIPLPSEAPKQRITFTPTNAIHSVLLSHRFYGDTSRELEIVARNNIRHPGFVPAGVPVEVVTDG